MNTGVKIVKTTKNDDSLWFSICGEIDHHSTKCINKEIDSNLFINSPRSVVLDLSKVDFMDSSGLGLILGRYRMSTELGIEFYIYEPTPAVTKLLKISGCDKFIKVLRKKTEK